MAKILIIGRNGQVSTYLQRQLADGYDVIVAGRDQLDLSEVESVHAKLVEIAPEIIINPAAYTAVDAAEDDAELAFAINRDAVAEIAQYSKETATPLIHFSTDYVFDGCAASAYLESDVVAPTGVYGQSKLEGEQAVIKSEAPALVLRTSWVYSNHGKNFYKTMLALAEQREQLSVVNDQVGAPTYAGSIASATKQLVDIIIEQGGISREQAGVYHFSCQGQTSWADFAKAIFVENEITSVVVTGIASSEYPTRAKRPAFSVLSTQKLLQTFEVSLPHWGTALSQCAADKEGNA
ncbi:dTDP-4-dehydrorhamnose reductase [Arenicella sp. 4NH20-0111]|uniref:dTDP-4-dehydrorhamnose reductase n=1 Tax=Arenicella sp. 4NH20-0111 TaxID=3127648 RepID=UPI00310B356E